MLPPRDTMYTDPAYRHELSRAGLNDTEAVLRCIGDRLAAWSRTTDTVQVHLKRNATWTGSVFVKRYHYPSWKHRLKGMFRGTFLFRSRARSEFDALHAMRSRGIQAVRPVAYGERRVLRFLRSCFLITEAVPGAMSLASFARRCAEGGGSAIEPAARREIITCLARQIRHMHEQGFVHGRLYARNILVRPLPERRFEFYLLDASSSRRIWPRRITRTAVVMDVARLAASARHACTRSDLLRFAKTYLGTDKLRDQDRAWMNRVAALSERFVRHEAYRLRLEEFFDVPIRHMDGVL